MKYLLLLISILMHFDTNKVKLYGTNINHTKPHIFTGRGVRTSIAAKSFFLSMNYHLHYQ